MEVKISEDAQKSLDKMDKSLQILFSKHIKKLRETPKARHMEHGVPYNTEEVTKQARIVFEIDETSVRIFHCFATHKEYEKWYKSFM